MPGTHRYTWPLYILLVLFVFLDTAYSFNQYLNEPLDGDLAGIVVPNEFYEQVLTDPFGLSAALNGEEYAAPNRFFAHAALSGYFLHAPLLLQRFVAPVDSIYLACAILKIAIHLLLLVVLAAYVTASVNWSGRTYLLALALLVPLFHASGYNMQMGLIDTSMTYTVFYALPSALVLLFFLPFYRMIWSGEALPLHWWSKILLIALAVLVAFNGPLVPGVVALVCPLVLGRLLWKNWPHQPGLGIGARWYAACKAIPKVLLGFFLLLGVLCLYSLFVGHYNSENHWATISVWQRYLRLPYGVYYQITPKLGIPLVLLMLVLNRYLLRRFSQNPEGQQMLQALFWVGLFSLAYILLLPLGGYRSYRPDILRRDTVQPVLLVLFLFYGASSLYLLQSLQGRVRDWYWAGVLLFVVGFTVADKPNGGKNTCERMALQQIAASTEKRVSLTRDCTVMQWEPWSDPAASGTNIQLLHHWNVVQDSNKRYYQSE